MAKSIEASNVTFWSDSTIICRQISGMSPVWHLRKLWISMQHDLRSYGSLVRHIGRTENFLADSLAKKGNDLPSLVHVASVNDLHAKAKVAANHY